MTRSQTQGISARTQRFVNRQSITLSDRAETTQEDDNMPNDNDAPQVEIRRVVTDAVNESMAIRLDCGKYKGDIGWEAVIWMEEFEDEVTTRGWTEQQKLDRFKGYLKDKAKRWYRYSIDFGTRPTTWAEMRKKFLDYHCPKDSVSYTRKRMLEYVQKPNDRVLHYIIEKLNRCLDYDKDMKSDEKLHYITEGLLPEIRGAILQQNVQSIEELQEAAEKVERGLQYMGKDIGSEVKRNQEMKKITDLCQTLTEELKRLKMESDEKDLKNNELIRELHHSRNSRSRERDNSRNRYSNGWQRESSRDRTGPNDRNTSRERNDYRIRSDSRDRNNSNNAYRPRSSERYDNDKNKYRAQSPHPNKKVGFDEARAMGNSRTIEAEPICYRCGKVGHKAPMCRETLASKDNASRSGSRERVVNNITEFPASPRNLMYRKVSINGLEITSLIDCGSEVSLIDSKLAKRLHLDQKGIEPRQVKAVNGSLIDIRSEAEAYICFPLGDQIHQIHIKLGVADRIAFSLLLGNDFNKPAGTLIDCKNSVIDFKPNEITSEECNASRYVHLIRNVVLKPNSARYVRVSVTKKDRKKTFSGFIRTAEELYTKRKIFAKEKAVEVADGRSSIELINPNSSEVVIPHGTRLGYLVDIDPHPVSSADYLSSNKVNALCGGLFSFNDTSDKAEAVAQAIKSGQIARDNWRRQLCTICSNIDHQIYECPQFSEWCDIQAIRRHFEKDRSEVLESIENDLEWDDSSLPMMGNICSTECKTSDKIEVNGGFITVNPDITCDQRQRLQQLLEENKDIFAFKKTELGQCTEIEHRIDTGLATPIYQQPRDLGKFKNEIITKQINEWLDLGIIKPCQSEWGSPVVLVGKKSVDEKGNREQRLCVDYRKLNNLTKRDAYPLPNTEACLDACAGNKFYSTLDMNSGYLQIKVAEEDIPKTAFVTRDGLFCFVNMPFGLKCAPMTFQRAMDYHMAGLKWKFVMIYLDDILVFSKDFDTHLEHLKEVFIRIRESGMTLNGKKLSLCMEEAKYLGNIISLDGRKPDPALTEVIRKFPEPTNLKGVQSFIGLANYYRQYVEGFSKITEPLSKLTKKEVGFMWTDEQQRAFDRVKVVLTSEPVLTHYDNTLPIELRCDGSTTGIGSVLLHRIDGKPRPIRYDSRLLTPAEKNYCISEIECLAIIYATIKCEKYLLGVYFTIISDHAALQWLATKENLSTRLNRWSLHMTKFDYSVVYKSGVNMKDADCLSRYPTRDPSIDEDNIDRHCEALLPMCSATLNNLVPGLENYTLQDIAAMQSEDSEFGPIYDQVYKATKGETQDKQGFHLLHSYTLIDDVLYRRVENKEGVGLAICLPIRLILYVLYAYHDDMFSGGHLGFQKTYEKLKSRVYWKNMQEIVRKYIQSCADCQSKKSENLPAAGLMVPFRSQAMEVFEEISIDIKGPMTSATSGRRYIFVATDHLSKYAVARAVRSATMRTMAEFLLEDIITKHGCPLTILTDRGKQFTAHFSEYLYKRLGVQHLMTTAYRPQCNGQVERMNRTLAEMLSMYCSNNQKDWDKGLQAVIFCYNTSVHATTGYSPFFLVHGREATLPPDRALRIPRLQYMDDEQILHNINHNLREAKKMARENIIKAATKSKEYHDKSHRNVSYAVGDFVWVYYPTRVIGQSDTLQHCFHGPFEVMAAHSNGVNYTIKGSAKGRKQVYDKVHVSRLKPYRFREDLIKVLEDKSYAHWQEENDASDEVRAYDIPLDQRDSDEETVVYDFSDIETPENISNGEIIPREKPIEEEHPEAEVIRDSTPVMDTQTENRSLPRRSPRTRKPRKLFNLFICSLLGLSMLMSADCGLQQLSPIVWHKTDIPVVNGINRVLISIAYKSPCNLFANPSLHTYNLIGARNLCEKQFQDDFITPMKNFCKEPIDYAEQKLTFSDRDKRAALLVVGVVGVITVAVTTVVGLVSNAIYQNHQQRREIGDLKQISEALAESLKRTQLNEEKMLELIMLLQKEVETLGKEVKSNTGKLDILTDTLPYMIGLTSNINSKLHMFNDRLTDVAKSWKEGKVNNKLLDLFNLTKPCDNCPLKYATPIECLIDTSREIVTLTFDAKTLRPNTTIIEAEPFRLYKQNNKNEVCPIIYSGPSQIMYDETTNCVVAQPKFPLRESNIAIVPDNENCHENLTGNFTKKYWTPQTCMSMEHFSTRDFVQVINTGANNVIYCEPLNVTIQNKTIICPKLPFPLPSSSAFSIGNFRYESRQITSRTQINFDSELTHTINFKLMPDLHNADFDALIEEFHQRRKETTPILPFDFSLKDRTGAPWFLIATLLILINFIFVSNIVYQKFLCGIWYCVRRPSALRPRRRLRASRNTNRGNTPDDETHSDTSDCEDIEMESTHAVVVHTVPKTPPSPKPRQTLSRQAPLAIPEETDIEDDGTPRSSPSNSPRVSPGPKRQKTVLLLTLICILTPIQASSQSVFLSLSYRNPCVRLEQYDPTPQDSNWCITQFRDSFLSPLEKFCTGNNETTIVLNYNLFEKISEPLTRRKRFSPKINQTESNNSTTANSKQSVYNIILRDFGQQFTRSRIIIEGIGLSWSKGIVDDRLFELPHSENHPDISVFSGLYPKACFLDKMCNKIRLELVTYRHDIHMCFKIGLGTLFVMSVLLCSQCAKRKWKSKRTRRVYFSRDPPQTMFIQANDPGSDLDLIPAPPPMP